MVAVLERILAHRDPVVTFNRMEDGGTPVPADHPAQAIVEAWEAYRPSAFGVTAKGRCATLVIVTRNVPGDVLGRLSLSWQLDPVLTDGFVDLLADLSVLLSSPLAVLSHQDLPGRPGWKGRESAHLSALEEALGPGVQYGLHRGLAGVAHRMVLGDELVAMFGEDRLRSLPGDLASRHGSGRWVLTPTLDPLEWTCDHWWQGEAAIIGALGPEHFFDPVTRALPSVVPEIPGVAPYPCHTRVPRTTGDHGATR